MKRKNFYKQVKFKDKESKKYLSKPIFYWAKKNEFFRQFQNITNYVSHSTVNSEKFTFNVRYPITISGMSLSDICIEDAKKKIYHIALIHEQIVYFEKEKGKIEIFCAKTIYEGEEGETFYSKKISYTVEE